MAAANAAEEEEEDTVGAGGEADCLPLLDIAAAVAVVGVGGGSAVSTVAERPAGVGWKGSELAGPGGRRSDRPSCKLHRYS